MAALPTDPITVTQAAAILGVTRCRVHQFLDAGRLTAGDLGNQYVLSRAEVERFAAMPRVAGNPTFVSTAGQ